MRALVIATMISSLALASAACQKSDQWQAGDGGTGSDADTDSDTDADSDTDSDADTDTWTAEDCPAGWSCYPDVTCDNDEDGAPDMGWTWLGVSGWLPGAERHGDEFTYEGDGVVLDEVTGLRWQRCTEVQFTDSCLAGFDEGYYVEDLPGLCEEAHGPGWRVPRVDELATLVDHGESSAGDSIAAIAAEPFPNTPWTSFWTATRVSYMEGDMTRRSGVYFDTGDVGTASESDGQGAVRCVLDGADGEVGARFGVDPASTGEIQDLRTGLIWRRCAEGQDWSGATCAGDAVEMAVEEADAACTGGWRLPGIRELFSIANQCFHEPALDPYAFPGAPLGVYGESSYWSSTAGFNPDTSLRWVARMQAGGTGAQEVETFVNGFVRCVRDP